MRLAGLVLAAAVAPLTATSPANACPYRDCPPPAVDLCDVVYCGLPTFACQDLVVTTVCP